MRTSARNVLRGIATSISHSTVNAEVGIWVADRVIIDAIITNESVDYLGLSPGKDVIALVKSSFVMLALDEPGLRLSGRWRPICWRRSSGRARFRRRGARCRVARTASAYDAGRCAEFALGQKRRHTARRGLAEDRRLSSD